MALKPQEQGKWPASLAAIKRYGQAGEFLHTFALANTHAYTATPESRLRCVIGTAPSLAVVSNAYGEDVADLWVFDFLTALCEACGQKPTAEQIEATAQAITAEFSHLKVTDFMLFSVRLRAGAFGTFYGGSDIMRVGAMLRDYCEWRTAAIAQWQKMEERQRAALTKRDIYENGISLAEHLATVESISEGGKSFLRNFMAQTPDDLQAVDSLSITGEKVSN